MKETVQPTLSTKVRCVNSDVFRVFRPRPRAHMCLLSLTMCVFGWFLCAWFRWLAASEVWLAKAEPRLLQAQLLQRSSDPLELQPLVDM
jgi:hypothetical protein